VASTNVIYNEQTYSNDVDPFSANGNVSLNNNDGTEFSSINVYSVCKNEENHDVINAENGSTCLPNEHVYGHIKHQNMHFSDQTYSQLSNNRERFTQANQYSHIKTPQIIEYTPDKDLTYNHLQVFTNNGVVRDIDDDLSYDISHAGGHDVEKEQSGENSNLRY
jgi:hypothetical protein